MGEPDGRHDELDAQPGDSIQERLYPDITCFGCGHANPRGLHLRSHPRPDGSVVATFTTWPEHDNGFGYVNGGIIATLLDCHSGAAVFHAAHGAGLRRAGGDPLLYVTAGLDLRYLRPTPLGVPVHLVAQVVEQDDDRSVVDVTLSWEDRVRASARADWRRWRPRPS
jgi:acyl-coenzyme A thioesterase PaaI-like protein